MWQSKDLTIWRNPSKSNSEFYGGHIHYSLSRKIESDTYPVLGRTQAEVLEGASYVFGKSGPKHVLVCSKLMPWLSHNGVHHIQPGNFILGLTLQETTTGKSLSARFGFYHAREYPWSKIRIIAIQLWWHAFWENLSTKINIYNSVTYLFNKLFNNLDNMLIQL